MRKKEFLGWAAPATKLFGVLIGDLKETDKELARVGGNVKWLEDARKRADAESYVLTRRVAYAEEVLTTLLNHLGVRAVAKDGGWVIEKTKKVKHGK